MSDNDASMQALDAALYRIFRALARPVLRHQVPTRHVVTLLKKAFVDIAAEEQGLSGRPASNARIAVMTGLTRSGIADLLKMKPPHQVVSDAVSNHPLNRLVAKWFRESPWSDENGPCRLPETGAEGSFEALAKSVGGDIAWQTLRGELLRAGGIRIEAGQVQLLQNAYLSKASSAHALNILGEDTAALVHTIESNLSSQDGARLFQRKAVFRELTPEGLDLLQQLINDKGQRLLEEADSMLSQHSLALEKTDSNDRISGVGIFVFDHHKPMGCGKHDL